MITICALVLLGWFAHTLKVFGELRKHDVELRLFDWLRSHPYQILSSITTAAIATVVLYYTGQLTPIAALLVAFTADSVIEAGGRRVIKVTG